MNEGKDGFGGKQFGQDGKRQDESLREKLEQQYSPDQTGSGDKGQDDSPFFGKGEGKEASGGSQWDDDKSGGSKGQFESDSEGESPEFDKGGIDGEKGGGRY